MTRRPVAALLVGGALLMGCATGQRPSFDTSVPFDGPTTGDANIDAVLTKLDAGSDGPFTADYSVVLALGGTTSEVEVVRDPGRQSITVNDIRFLELDGQRQTCRLGAAEPCESEWQAQYVSDTIINPDLVGNAAANRLRRDAAAAIAPTVLEDASFAGQPAQCVRITVPGGEVQYCVLSTGLLARLVDSDLTIDLVAYQPTADEAAFSPT